SGNDYSRSKNNLKDYRESRFIDKITAEHVHFVLHSRPPLQRIIKRDYWKEFTNRTKIVQEIPRGDARWIGQLLAQLSDEQMQNAFRAAGYSSEQTRLFTKVLRNRINKLLKL
ncbi:MAG: hypothetical protein AB1489_25710, partial [Acidobacteriota bacterium]